MKRIDIISIAVAVMLALFGGSCADDFGFEEGNSSPLTVTLALPQTESVATRATMGGTADECRINDLRLIAFPQGGQGELLNTALSVPSDGAVSAEMRVNDIKPGEYRIYLVANMGSKVSGVKSEAELRDVVINYGSASMPALPMAGNLPMIYEPTAITAIGKTPSKLTASLAFSCVKVSLNLIFDKTGVPECQSEFGDKGLRISKVETRNVSTQTTLGWQKKVIDAAYNATLPAGRHFSTWTRTPGNATVDDANVISALSGEFTPADPDAKWCYNQVIYLPERYVNNDDKQTVLAITGETFKGNATSAGNSTVANNSYEIALGHMSDGHRNLPRDTYYEVIGTVKSLGALSNIQTEVSVKPWGQVAIDASMRHTLLSVDRTTATVSSLNPEIVHYTSSASSVEFECMTPYIQGKPIIIAEHNASAKAFTLKINPAISIDQLGANPDTGQIKVRLKANNIVKYIDVAYDIKPMFEVSETTHMAIYDPVAPHTNVFIVTTNLGGVKFGGKTSSWSLPYQIVEGNAKATVSMTTLSEGVYQVSLTMNSNPVTSTTKVFEIGPASTTFYDEFSTDITYIMKPQPGDYRIYMRAINDRINDDGTMQSIMTEQDGSGNSSSNNWTDGWGGAHKVYFYYQFGESGGTDEIPVNQVWEFSSNWPGDDMTKDNQNPGWYYKTYSPTLSGKNRQSGAVDNSKKITPGESLLIFNRGENAADRHRFTHHMDPGITLFNYYDREGWYLYDPTCDPYFRYYDEKPVIEDVTYVVYTKAKVTGWTHTYGVAGNDVSSRYTIKSNSTDVSSVLSGSWYKTTFRLKAPRGEYEKAIKLLGPSGSPILYGGNSWKEGYFDGSKWYKGKPSGL